MRKSLWVFGVVITVALAFDPAFAAGLKVSDATLQGVLNAMSPQLATRAVAATCVRTTYEPQALETYVEGQDVSVKRTTISELVVSSKGVRETVCDARRVNVGVKQYAFHCANDGKRLQVYDSRTKRGSTRKSPEIRKNPLLAVTCPFTRMSSSRYMSRGLPTLVDRLRGARVASEASAVAAGRNAITLEGEYEGSDPQRYFAITVVPDFDYAVVELKEYDADKRILTDMRADGFVSVSGELWLPKAMQHLFCKFCSVR